MERIFESIFISSSFPPRTKMWCLTECMACYMYTYPNMAYRRVNHISIRLTLKYFLNYFDLHEMGNKLKWSQREKSEILKSSIWMQTIVFVNYGLIIYHVTNNRTHTLRLWVNKRTHARARSLAIENKRQTSDLEKHCVDNNRSVHVTWFQSFLSLSSSVALLFVRSRNGSDNCVAMPHKWSAEHLCIREQLSVVSLCAPLVQRAKIELLIVFCDFYFVDKAL